jgi:hypothetical protein
MFVTNCIFKHIRGLIIQSSFYIVQKGVILMEQRIEKLEADMVDIKTRLAVAESNIKDMREDISAIKNNTTWILRIILGAIITGLLGLLAKGGI